MNPLDMTEVCKYVNDHIDDFHKKRLEVFQRLKLKDLTDKNPYLLRAKNVTKASDLIDSTMAAFLSSSEEKQFGDFLEDLAIFIASKTTGGKKSTAPGIDLEFDLDGTYNIISIKSGVNWGNQAQHNELANDFNTAEKRLKQSSHIKNVQKILGICYGKTKSTITKKGYIKLVGQNFWTFISGNQRLFIEIIEPIGYHAKEHNDTYIKERDRITNLLTRSFIETYCIADGSIDWEKLARANSGNFDLDRFFN